MFICFLLSQKYILLLKLNFYKKQEYKKLKISGWLLFLYEAGCLPSTVERKQSSVRSLLKFLRHEIAIYLRLYVKCIYQNEEENYLARYLLKKWQTFRHRIM